MMERGVFLKHLQVTAQTDRYVRSLVKLASVVLVTGKLHNNSVSGDCCSSDLSDSFMCGVTGGL